MSRSVAGTRMALLALVVFPLAAQPPTPRAFFDRYCVTCHNQKLRTAGLTLDLLDPSNPAAHAEIWERVIGKLRAGAMPPPGMPRADSKTYAAVASTLEDELDAAWKAHPTIGAINPVHRLNRVEYENSVRDLLGVDVDVKALLPGDETADGSFDNFADSLSISTVHLERYLSVARQATRLAVGLPPSGPKVATFEIPLHVLQDERQDENLPLGSRGGIAIPYDFPVAGDYSIKVRLQRQYQDYIKGMGWPEQLDVRLDGKLVKRFTVGGGAKGRPAATSYAGDGEPNFAGDPSWEQYMQTGGDAGLQLHLTAPVGRHIVGVSFVREFWEPEGLPQPLQRGRVIADDQVYMGYANVGSVQIGGPYDVLPATQLSDSQKMIFSCRPKNVSEEQPCAEKILARLAHRAYRRPVNAADVATLMKFFASGRRDGGTFDAGIQLALERMLVDPDFLLRVHREDAGSAPERIGDLELASRLSFFLWSSIPDERLLTLAEHHELSKPPILEGEVRRMLADPRAVSALVDNFAAQWLNLRRVDEVVVDPERYPNYDLSLLQAFRRETELFVASTIREDRPVRDLLDANYTFVNERLAEQYGILGIYGSRFRRVTLPDHSERGGILAQGALLATTSYPDRTSPVLRGKWLLNNIFDQPIPPPPPGVDTNIDGKPGAMNLSIRERLARHRTSPTCASCHSVIDPLGFSLENFDVIGGWRTKDEAGRPVDAVGATMGGAKIEGLTGLRALLFADPEQFPRTVTTKLMAYAIGRRIDYYDRPSVREIVHGAAASGYPWSALILGIVKSPEFLMWEPRHSSEGGSLAR